MQIDYTPKLGFDEITLVPQFTDITSRSDVSLSRSFTLPHSKRIWGPVIPICAANMSTVGTITMAKELIKHQCITALHKHYSLDKLVSFWKYLKDINAEQYVFYSLGTVTSDLEKLRQFIDILGRSPANIALDVANGYQSSFYDIITKLREEYPNVNLMAGNIVSPEATYKVIKSGADGVKCGISQGSACETAIVAGTGYPQWSAVYESAPAAINAGGYLVSDGGITNPGCCAKAFGAGAAVVMMGGMLAGHDECESEFKYDKRGNKTGVEFYGMSSKKAMEKYNNGVANYRSSEGKSVVVDYRGPVEYTINHILGGIRSACSYSNAKNLDELYKNAKFVVVKQTHNKVFG